MKIGVLCAHFPPIGQVSARRPYFIAKYLKDFGHDVTVYTSNQKLESKANWMPDCTGFKIIHLNNTELHLDRNRGHQFRAIALVLQLLNKVPGALPKRVAQVGFRFFFPLSRELNLSFNNESINARFKEQDLVIASGSPWALFRLGSIIKKNLGVRLVLDYRDPWNAMNERVVLDSLGKYNNNLVSKWIKKKNIKIEKSILKTADALITVSEPIASNLKLLAGTKSVYTIYNGFDRKEQSSKKRELQGFNITYTGTYRIEQNVTRLFDALEVLFQSQNIKKDFRINFIGVEVAESVKPILKPFYDFKNKYPDNITITGFIDREEVAEIQNSSDMLLHLNYVGKEGILSSKLFQYLGVGRPVLFLSDQETFSEQLIKETNCGFVCKNRSEITQIVEQEYNYWLKHGTTLSKTNQSTIEPYSFEYQIKRLENILLNHRNN